MLRNRISYLVLLLALLASCDKAPTKEEGSKIPLCDIQVGSCEGRLDDGTVVHFDITPKPVRSLQELQFTVTMPDVQDAKILVDLTMPAMYMGENKVALVPAGDGNYTGKGSIVKCTSGDRLWDAGVQIDRGGKTSVVHFQFEMAP